MQKGDIDLYDLYNNKKFTNEDNKKLLKMIVNYCKILNEQNKFNFDIKMENIILLENKEVYVFEKTDRI